MKHLRLAFGLFVVIEIVLLFWLVQRTSLLTTFAYLFLSAGAGIAVIVRAAHRALVVRPAKADDEPREVLPRSRDGLFSLAAGVLLIIPGIVSDLLALVLLTPVGQRAAR